MKRFGLSRIKKICIVLFLCNSVLCFFVTGQSAISHPLGELSDDGNQTISYKGSRNYKFTERSDLRLYQNGRYVGLQSKIVSAFIIPTWSDRGLVYEGDFYIDQDTNRNKSQVALGIHEAIPSSFITLTTAPTYSAVSATFFSKLWSNIKSFSFTKDNELVFKYSSSTYLIKSCVICTPSFDFE